MDEVAVPEVNTHVVGFCPFSLSEENEVSDLERACRDCGSSFVEFECAVRKFHAVHIQEETDNEA